MDAETIKRALYRVQQRLAITRSEAAFVCGLAALLLVGLAARLVQSQPRAVPGRSFAATDRRFQRGAARLRAATNDTTNAAGNKAGNEATNAAANATTRGANATTRGANASPPSEATPLRLNAASAGALEALPGVGPVIAGRIVAYRTAHGPFAEIGHLERVSGIGPKTLRRLAPLVTLSGPGRSPAAEEEPAAERKATAAPAAP